MAEEIQLLKDQLQTDRVASKQVILRNTCSGGGPSNVLDAEIMIVDVNGRVVKRILITSRDVNSSLTVYSSDLNSGVYFYSLIGDGHVLETKKMVCSK